MLPGAHHSTPCLVAIGQSQRKTSTLCLLRFSYAVGNDSQYSRNRRPTTTHALYKKARKTRSPLRSSENISVMTHLPTTQKVYLTFKHWPPVAADTYMQQHLCSWVGLPTFYLYHGLKLMKSRAPPVIRSLDLMNLKGSWGHPRSGKNGESQEKVHWKLTGCTHAVSPVPN